MRDDEKQINLFSLGDDGSNEALDTALNDDQYYKLENEKGSNIFGLLAPDFRIVQDHWVDIDGERKRFACGVHGTGDMVKIAKGFSPDDCPFCQIMLDLYRQAKDEKDKFAVEKKELANDIRCGGNIFYIATPGDASYRRVSGKRVLTPDFGDIIPGYLRLTQSSSEMLRSEFRAQGLTSKDAVGLPVNFERGKKTAKARFSQVIEVELFPKRKIKNVPKNLPDFGNLVQFDREALEEAAEIWLKELNNLLAQKAGKAKKRK